MKIKAIKMLGVTEKWQLLSFISYEQSLFYLSPKGTTNKGRNFQQGQQILYVNIHTLNHKNGNKLIETIVKDTFKIPTLRIMGIVRTFWARGCEKGCCKELRLFG
jgi:hypothetical protein